MKRKIRGSKIYEKSRLAKLFKFVSASQYLILFLLTFVILQLLFFSRYNILLLKGTVYVSYLVGFVALAILTYKLIVWYKFNHNLLVAVYLLAVGTICLNSVFTVISLNTEFDIRPDIIRYARSLTGGFAPGQTMFSGILDITYILSFLLTWIATGLLLRKMKHRIIYWIAMSVPMIYFFSQIQPFVLNLFYDSNIWNRSDTGVVYTFFLNTAKPIGGILFGIAFWYMSKSINHVEIKNYMIISAYGMMLMFASNQPTGLIQVPFPPFGLVTTAFFGLASFLFLIGVYSSAISVSQDMTIRKYLINYTQRLAFLSGIGSSEMEHETQKIVKKVLKDVTLKAESMEETTGIAELLTRTRFKRISESCSR